jgi:hypothetical protein
MIKKEEIINSNNLGKEKKIIKACPFKITFKEAYGKELVFNMTYGPIEGELMLQVCYGRFNEEDIKETSECGSSIFYTIMEDNKHFHLTEIPHGAFKLKDNCRTITPEGWQPERLEVKFRVSLKDDLPSYKPEDNFAMFLKLYFKTDNAAINFTDYRLDYCKTDKQEEEKKNV